MTSMVLRVESGDYRDANGFPQTLLTFVLNQ
jgi:hypothetical protein